MRSPMFWLAIAYAAGLALFASVDDSPCILFGLSLASLALGALFLHKRLVHLTYGCVLAGFLLLGGAAIRLENAAVPSHRIDRLLEAAGIDLSEAVRITGWLRREPEQKPFASFYELELESLETGGRTHAASGGVRLAYYLPERGPEPKPASTASDEQLTPLHYGDRLQALLRVHRPVRYQNPGSFDWRAHLARQEIFLEGSLKSPTLLEKLPGRRGVRLLAWTYGLRTRLLNRLDGLISPVAYPDQNAVLRAMLLGDTSFLNHPISEGFRTSGTYHVLVVSGLNVGLLAAALFWLVRRLGATDEVTTAVTIPFLVLYLLLVEDRPPVERAVWMVGFYLFTRLLYRRVHVSNPTALAALLVLFLHPEWLFDPSFHLSFAAVFLIAFLVVPWMERTSEPYRNATRFLDAEELDDRMPEPHLAQFRLDLRALAALAAPALFWVRDRERRARWLLGASVKIGLRTWDLLLLSLAIQLGFVLLSAIYFERVIWIGLLTNILVVPLVGVVVPLGLGVLLLALASMGLATVPALMLRELTTGLLQLVSWFGRPGLSYPIPPPPLWVGVFHLAALVWLARAVARGRHQRWAALALTALILIIILYPFAPQRPSSLEATVLDVGQGDSIFLAFPSGETWLVDSGSGPRQVQAGYRLGHDMGENVVAPFLRSRGLKRIDHLWLTHAHHDHMGGLGAILEEFAIGAFHVGRNPESKAYTKLLAELGAHKIPLAQHHAGERFRVAGTEIEILWPDQNYQLGPTPSNNDSLVLRLCLPAVVGLPAVAGLPAPEGRAPHCLLLPADIESPVEKHLAASGVPLRAEVLKVPHHGGRGAGTTEFLTAVAPSIAIVSAGATNPFGHPRQDTLERVRAQGTRVYRTDRHGAVTVRLEEKGVRVRTFVDDEPPPVYPNLLVRLVACLGRTLKLELFR